jgi:hypothetical protein
MEVKQSIDLEKVYEMFCEKAGIKEDANIVIKDLEENAWGNVLIEVVEKVDSNLNFFTIYQGHYDIRKEELTSSYVHLGSYGLRKILSHAKVK